MASIQIDDNTAARIAAIASGRGMSVEEYLRSIVERDNVTAKSALPPQDFDAELTPLLFDGPNLPTNFSRADIYVDHD